MTDRETREQALSILAIKTQAVRYDALVMAAYLDDERVAGCRTDDFVAACRKLETGEWFPKFGELVKAIGQAIGDRIDRMPKPRLLEPPPQTPEEAARILDKLYAATGKTRRIQ